MGYTIAQHDQQGYASSVTPLTLTYDEPTTPGSLLLLSVTVNANGVGHLEVSDDVNGAWTRIAGEESSECPQLWAVINTGEGTPTVTIPKPTNFTVNANLYELTGNLPSLDGLVINHAEGFGAGETTEGNQPSVTVTDAGEMIWTTLAGHTNPTPGLAVHAGIDDVGSYTLEQDWEGGGGKIADAAAIADNTGAASPFWSWEEHRGWRQLTVILAAETEEGEVIEGAGGTLSAGAAASGNGTLRVNGGGELSASGSSRGSGVMRFNGGGSLASSATVTGSGSVRFTGAGSVGAVASWSGHGALRFNGTGRVSAEAGWSGAGMLRINGHAVLIATSSWTGHGGIVSHAKPGGISLTVEQPAGISLTVEQPAGISLTVEQPAGISLTVEQVL